MLVVCDIIFVAFSGLYVWPSAPVGVWSESYVFQIAIHLHVDIVQAAQSADARLKLNSLQILYDWRSIFCGPERWEQRSDSCSTRGLAHVRW